MTIINITKIWGRAKIGKYQSSQKYHYCEKKIKAFQEVSDTFSQFVTSNDKALHKDFIKYLNISEVSSRSGIPYGNVEKILNGNNKSNCLLSLKLVVGEAVFQCQKFIELCEKQV